MKDSPYFKQAELMLRAVPHVAAEACFAIKGGTAINFFVRDMPRLSVDIDLAYLPVDEPREAALKKIGDALDRIAAAIEKTITGAKVRKSRAQKPARLTKLFVATGPTRIKIEPNEIIRGSVFPAEEHELSRQAEDLFELSATAQTLSIADLYGGKLCAALDRQHPRDLFDVKLLLGNEGITDKILEAFVVYLASHNRPIHELLNPTRKDVRRIYENEFAGMATEEVPYEDLIEARDALIGLLRKNLTDSEKTFLVSLQSGEPDWDVMGINGIENLPAIRWKLANIKKIGTKKGTELLAMLKKTLDL